MSYIASSNGPGMLFVEPVTRPGKRKHFGTLVHVQGHQTICAGYTPDGKSVVYIPIKQLESIRGAVARANRKLLYRILKKIIAHYERKTA